MRMLAIGFILGLLFTEGVMSAEAISDKEWVITTITNVHASAKTTITFRADGSVGGDAACNSFNGLYEESDGALSISMLMSTERACPALDEEGRFFAALSAVTAWRSSLGSLELLDQNNIPLIVGYPASEVDSQH